MLEQEATKKIRREMEMWRESERETVKTRERACERMIKNESKIDGE